MGIYTITKAIPADKLISYVNLGWLKSSERDGLVNITKQIQTGSDHNDFDSLEHRQMYLVQRGKIRRPLGKHVGQTLSQAVSMDYMGSAEFEYGALPKSFRRIEAQFLLYKKITVKEVTACLGDSDRTFTLRLFANFDTPDDEVIYVRELLETLRGQRRLKESLRIEMDKSGVVVLDPQTYADFWWDIRNDVFFSFDKQFMSRLPEHLQASFEQMNSKC